jgi:hypothetical protein
MAKDDIAKEDLPFEVPEFNEDEFVRKELISFRTTIILFAYSLVVAFLTFVVWRQTQVGFLILLLIALAAGAAIPLLYRLVRIDYSHFRRKEWIGTMFLHFFFWLGFTLLLTNPPISDNAPPVVEMFGAPSVQGLGGSIQIAAYVGDNDQLAAPPTFCIERQNSSNCEPAAFVQVNGKPAWTYTWTPTQEGTYSIFAQAQDKSGLNITATTNVSVANPFPVIDAPTRFESLSQSLTVRPASGFRELRAVQYVIDGVAYNMIPPSTERPNYWRTDPTFPGWKPGTNNVSIRAIEQPMYLHSYKLEGGIAESASSSRVIQVSETFPDRATGKEPTVAEKRAPNLAQTPGPGAAVMLALLVVLAVGLRARRKE